MRPSVCFALLLFVLSAGCAPRQVDTTPASVSWQTQPGALDPMRVGVLPPWLGPRAGPSAGVLADELSASLRQRGLHEVRTVSAAERDRALAADVIASGRFALDDLLRLRDQLAIDAVLVSRVEQFTSYDPIAIGLGAYLVSCRDGTVLWSASAQLDGARADVQRDIERWWDVGRGSAAEPPGGWSTVLRSPSRFCRYVADTLVATMGRPVPAVATATTTPAP
jgi:hypothetical protein